MSGREQLRSQMEGLLAAQSAAAAAKLMANAPADEELKRIEQVERLMKCLPESNKGVIYTAGAVGLACLIVASLLWTTPWPSNHVQLNATTESVTIGLARPIDWSGDWDLGPGLLRLDNMSSIVIPPELSAANTLSGRAWLEGSNGDFAVTQLQIQPGAKLSPELSVEKSGSQILHISSRNASLLGRLQAYGSSKIEAGSSPQENAKLAEFRFDIPGTITFFHKAADPEPAALRVTPKGTLTLTGLAVEYISFAREAKNSETSFQSGIVLANLTTSTTGEKSPPLEAGSRLRLEGVQGVISALTLSSEGIHLVFDGKVKSASVGPPGYERQLTPSVLEYFFHQQKLGFFWAAASFIWGLLWSARTLIFR